MHISVREILAEDLGYHRTFAITGETPHSDRLKLAGPIEGEIKLTRLEDGIAATGTVRASVELECHRCLRTFTRDTSVRVERLFRDQPTGDDLPIDRRTWEIDVLPMIEEELLVFQPIKLLCEEDCPGLCTTCGGRLDDTHQPHTNN